MRAAAAVFLSVLAVLAATPAAAIVLAGFGDSITQGVPYVDYIPNGDRVNMGAYGNTRVASSTYRVQGTLTVVR